MWHHKRGNLLHKVALIALWITLVLAIASRPSHAQEGTHQAGLVIRYSDDLVETYCVAFSEPEISGLELLRRSGVPLVVDPTQSWGVAVCKIGEQGCDYPSQPCFCQCQGEPCVYWAYYHLKDNQWVYSEVGASQYMVRHGMVEGWSWGEGLPGQGTPPPVISFAQICGTSSQETGRVLDGETLLPSLTNLAASVLPFAALLAAVLASGWVLVRRRRQP